jgi:hypothetical protein
MAASTFSTTLIEAGQQVQQNAIEFGEAERRNQVAPPFITPAPPVSPLVQGIGWSIQQAGNGLSNLGFDEAGSETFDLITSLDPVQVEAATDSEATGSVVHAWKGLTNPDNSDDWFNGAIADQIEPDLNEQGQTVGIAMPIDWEKLFKGENPFEATKSADDPKTHHAPLLDPMNWMLDETDSLTGLNNQTLTTEPVSSDEVGVGPLIGLAVFSFGAKLVSAAGGAALFSGASYGTYKAIEGAMGDEGAPDVITQGGEVSHFENVEPGNDDVGAVPLLIPAAIWAGKAIAGGVLAGAGSYAGHKAMQATFGADTTEGQEFGSEFLSNPETLSPIDFNPSLISDSYQHQTDMPFHEVMGADPYQAQQNPVDALA